MKNIVVTGVPSGIGRATAKTFVNKGWSLFGTVREPTQADALQREFGSMFTPLVVDVRNETSVHAAAEQVAAAIGQQRVQGLVNCAGIETVDSLTVVPLSDVQTTFNVHVFGMLPWFKLSCFCLAATNQNKGTAG
jgi:NAD(P)-dependent dehydrogenase (short-subunit alcohol dehydrogenase family)